MPGWFLPSFGAVALAAVALRLLTRGRWAARSGRGRNVDVVLLVLGGLGLTFHCAAMFHRGSVAALPLVDTVNALGTGSVVAFAVPALLVLAGLRRVPAPALALVTLALAAVGVTMYDGGPLAAHLTAIFVTVVLLIGVAVLLVPRPGSRGRGLRTATA